MGVSAMGPAPGRPKPDRAPWGQERSDWGASPVLGRPKPDRAPWGQERSDWGAFMTSA